MEGGLTIKHCCGQRNSDSNPVIANKFSPDFLMDFKVQQSALECLEVLQLQVVVVVKE